MNRKLVQQGSSTLMVSLPKKWANNLHLHKGDEIEILEQDNHLIISKNKTITKRETTINLGNYTESSIRTFIVNAYRSGYDQVNITFHDDAQFHTIVYTLRQYLLGYEITNKEKNSCVIENITEPSQDQFDILLRKILYNISLLIEGTQARLQNKSEFAEYPDLSFSIHKYDNFCRRVIAKKNPVGSTSALYWSFLGLLVHGQRELYHLNKYLDKHKIQLKDTKIIDRINHLFQLLSDGFIHKDIQKLEQVHELEKEIIYQELYQLLGKKESIVYFHLGNATKNFYLASSPLMGLLLESKTSK